MPSQDFTTAGSNTFTVPAGVTSITVKCWGAGEAGTPGSFGVGGQGGYGADFSTAVLAVNPGEEYAVNAGDRDNIFSRDSFFQKAFDDFATLVLAPGGGTFTPAVGDTQYTGGAGQSEGGGGGGAGSEGNGSGASGTTGGAGGTGDGGSGGDFVSTGNGFDGQSYGGGGGGGGWDGGDFNGGIGGAGRVLVEWTDPVFAPDAIDDLAATPGDESLEFTWSEPADGGAAISKYSLYLNGVLHTDNVTSPHDVTGLTNGVASGPWTVTATNSEGESDPSNEVTETPFTVPDAIDDLAAEAGVYKLTFTWSAPDDGGAAITKYTLKKDGVLHTDEVTSPHEVTGLSSGVASNGWTVTATNAAGESDPSNSVGGTPTDPPPPTAPTDLAATSITTTSLTLTWADNSDSEDNFLLYSRLAGVGDYVQFDSAAADAESIGVTGLEPATAYDFRIIATNIGGNSDPCDLLNVSTLSDSAGGRARLLLGVG